jgi:transcriptional regulator
LLRNSAASVGVQIPITRFEGKRKISENRSEADRAGVAAGLSANRKIGRLLRLFSTGHDMALLSAR